MLQDPIKRANPHEGHRERLMERFLNSGLDGFDAHQCLELLLFYSIPRKDTNELAHRLLERFGNLSGVFDASLEDLKEVEGIGGRTATLLKLMPAMSRRYMTDKDKDLCINSSEKAGRYLLPHYVGRTEECVYIVCLDVKGRVLATHLMFQGSIDAAEINIRKLAFTALRHNAAGVILSHNHPGGVALPSGEDLAATERVKQALTAVGVRLLDHIIVADNDFVSLADSGAL